MTFSHVHTHTWICLFQPPPTHTLSLCRTSDVCVCKQKSKEEAAPTTTKALKKHLNIVFCGHVDAGKSTISGHIMYLTGQVRFASVCAHTHASPCIHADASGVEVRSCFTAFAILLACLCVRGGDLGEEGRT